MTRIIFAFASLLIAMFLWGPPASAWAHANGYGGRTWHAYGATAHTKAFGGGTAHVYGEGAIHSNRYGATSYDRYYGGSTAAYHPPVVVNSYSSGCYNCGGWAAAAGMAAGAAIGAAAATSQADSAYGMGAIYATLPVGCASQMVQAETYYLCGSTWFSPFYGANGVSYRVVPTP